MAIAGTITGVFSTTTRHWLVAITGITNPNVSPSFDGKGYQNSSYVISGTFASASVQAQGSNDGGVTWVNIGSAVTAAGGGTLSAGEVFELYRFSVSGGGATTLLNANCTFVSNNAS